MITYLLKLSSECLCNADGSVNSTCTDDGGVCTCIANVIGDKCDVCETGWYSFPSCQGEICNFWFELFFVIFDKYLQNVNVMQLVQSITVVLMMVEFVLVLLMSLVLNVILVKLVGLVSHLVKVRYIIISGQPNLSKIWYYSIFRSAQFCLARFCSVFSGKPNQISIG